MSILPRAMTLWEAARALDDARRLMRDRQPAEAEERCREILRAQPSHPDALHLLGLLLLGRGRGDLAVGLLRRAVTASPNVAGIHRDLGHALRSQGMVDEALASYERAYALDPDPGLRVTMALLLPVIPRSTADIAAWRSRLTRGLDALAAEGLTLDDPLAQVGTTAFHLAYHGLSDREIQEHIARFYVNACPDLTWSAPHCRPGTTRQCGDGRLKIGIVTAYLREHTIAKVNRGLIAHLDRDRFHVTVLHLGAEDAWTGEIAATADRAVRLTGTLAEMRHTIAAEELDLLFYVDVGMHAATTFLAYARLAPVHCVSWGHPVSTGIPNVDFYISSRDLEPPSRGTEYSERLVTFDRLPTFYHRPQRAGTRRDRAWFGFDEHQRLYVCPQLLFKLHPDVDRVLGDILRRDPQGILVFLEGERGTESYRQILFRERFTRANPEVADFIVFRPFLDGDAFIDLLEIADVLLDPPWFGGGNTSLEAFSVGTPIVTWPGPFARGRTTYAGFRRMDVLDGIVASLDDYADRAVAIATDPAWRSDIRDRILARNHLLYEDRGVIREFEDFFERAIATATERKDGRP
jgi:predicted O-linked N-acetylglucosamine transferase (SPINDLY family)